MEITTIGLDLAKHWFQVHGVDANGRVVVRRRLWRSGVIAYFRSLEPCLVGMEACATAHYWARELIALGHRVKLMPPAYVKAYVKRNKNDAADAEAICEAVARPSMRFVPVKDAEQQSVLMLHRARSLLVRQRTMLVNALRAHMAEFGIIAPQGLRHVEILTKTIAHQQERLPELARAILQMIVGREPILRRRPLTLGAVAIAARVVSDVAVAAILAALDMPAERGRTALLDRRHDLELLQAHMSGIGPAPVGPMAMKDICNLQPREAHGRRLGLGSLPLVDQGCEPVERAGAARIMI